MSVTREEVIDELNKEKKFFSKIQAPHKQQERQYDRLRKNIPRCVDRRIATAKKLPDGFYEDQDEIEEALDKIWDETYP